MPNSGTSVLKPGILVSLKTSLQGGVTYQRRDLKVEEPAPEKVDVAKWETTRVIEDVEEHEAALKARSKAASCVRGVCALTSFGLLCAEQDEAKLDEGIAEARKIADEFNADARLSQLSVYVLKGRIASTDEEAARAIASDVNDLLIEMETGIQRAGKATIASDVSRAVEVIRDAASRAKRMGAILDESQGQKVGAAIEAARKAAREIVKRVQKEGEDAAKVVATLDLSAISGARFLDLDAPAPMAGKSLPEAAGRQLDLTEAMVIRSPGAQEEADRLGLDKELPTAQIIDLGEELKKSVEGPRTSAYVGRRISEVE